MILNLGIKQQGEELYKLYKNHDRGETVRQWNSLLYSLKASSSLGEFTSGLATVTF